MITIDLIDALINAVENEKNTYYQFWVIDLPKTSYIDIRGKKFTNTIQLNGRTLQLRKRNSFAVIPVTTGNIKKYNI